LKGLLKGFWWPFRSSKSVKYSWSYGPNKVCDNCTEQPVEKLVPNSIPEKSWIYISADFITKLPLVQRYDSILVVVDRLIKMVYFIFTTEKTLAEGLARLFRDNIWKLHGLPESIILDKGS